MELDIREVVTEVRPFDDRTALRPDVLAQVVAATLAELDKRRDQHAQVARETQLWHSVRAGSGR